MATDRSPSGSSGPLWRWALAAALVAGVAWVALRHPAVPAETWPDPTAYRPEGAVCADARDGRQWTTYRVPDALAAPEGVTIAAVARRFNLEAAPVCRANGIDDLAACEETQIEPGRELALPLTPDDSVVAAARAAIDAREGE